MASTSEVDVIETEAEEPVEKNESEESDQAGGGHALI